FYDVYWPSFRKRDFLKIIKIYQSRRNESQR
ncbi:MAG: undecaprenyl diphosphate synthase family protein, partial [Thermoplasmata archaeon]|nr:undecaprenyl diphosphate synthase family protein [Thermoplasmata archaeon]